MEHLSISDWPDTHLPGFARAFLSLSFQWIARPDDMDWNTALPAIDFPDDNELL
jgi:DnaJ family protein A protein 5